MEGIAVTNATDFNGLELSDDIWPVDGVRNGNPADIRARLDDVVVGGAPGVNAVDQFGRTPLHYAATFGNLNDVVALLDSGVDPNFPDGLGNGPLHLAANKGSVEVVKELVTRGADVNARNNNGETPLHEAVWIVKPSGIGYSREGQIEVTSLLLEKGADVNAADEFGKTPLHDAASSNRVEEVKLLLDWEADINIMNRFGETPLDMALDMYSSQEMIDLLKSEGAKTGAEIRRAQAGN